LKRVLVISDPHHGHRGGLTPPSWQYSKDAEEDARSKYGYLQSVVWEWFKKSIDEIGPVDLLVCNGDSIDGRGERSGSTELITVDRREQCEIAAECINIIERKKLLLIRGTPYHTGNEEDWEDVLAGMVNATDIGSHEWVDADGVIMDFKHKIGSSAVPYGRLTAPGRDALWNMLWAERGIQPESRVIVRSHVHYFAYGGDANRLWLTTPCLQAWSKYGTAQCSGTIDIGMILFECDKGAYTWRPILLDLQFMKSSPLKL